MKNNKLKVIQICGSKGPGGAETFFMRMMVALHHRDEVELLPIVRKNSWLNEQLISAKIPHQTAPFGGMLDFATTKFITAQINEFKPDLIQSWMNRAGKFLPKTTVPTVGRLGGYYSLKYYKNCDYLVGNTEGIREFIIKQGWPKNKAFYIPNFAGEPPADFANERYAVRGELNIPDNAFVLIVAGRLHENKGVDIALYALSLLPDNVYMIIAGDGPLQDTLKSTAEADGLTKRVRFLPWVSRITSVAAAADVWLVPSRHEPLGNVILDAWMHKLPVIASSVSGPVSLIKNNETGILVEAESAKGIVDAVESLMSNPGRRDRLAKNGYEYVIANFSRDVVIDKFINFYRKIAKQK